MNWAIPSAPAEDTTDGFHPDSASIWAASRGGEIPGHREPAWSSTGTSPAIGMAAVASTGELAVLDADPATTTTSPTTPKARANTAVATAVSVLVDTWLPLEISSQQELGRKTAPCKKNSEKVPKLSAKGSRSEIGRASCRERV